MSLICPDVADRRRGRLTGMELALGDRRYDVATRALVMGILNRTTDSFYDKGAFYEMDRFLGRAEQLVDEGADILDVVIPAVEALRARFDIPISADTWRASVAKAAYEAGAVVGNDISGFADPD